MPETADDAAVDLESEPLDVEGVAPGVMIAAGGGAMTRRAFRGSAEVELCARVTEGLKGREVEEEAAAVDNVVMADVEGSVGA